MIFDKSLSKVTKSGYTLHLRNTHEIHHEVELGLMIGKKARSIQAADWHHHIEGYFVGIDFTDRDL